MKFGEGVQFMVGALAAGCMALTIIIFWLNITPTITILSFLGVLHFSSYCIPPSASLIQMATPQALRARVYALFLCMNNLIGMSIGALIVGILNDYVFKSPSSVGTSISLVVFFSAICSGIILMIGYQYSRIKQAELKWTQAGKLLDGHYHKNIMNS